MARSTSKRPGSSSNTSPPRRAREKGLFGYENYDVFVESAQNQSYGLWQYRANIRWKELGYDTTSERLFSTDPSTRYTVDEFIDAARKAVNQYL